MKIRNAGLLLIIASSATLLVEVYSKVSLLFGEYGRSYLGDPLNILFSLVWLFLAVVLLILGITLYKGTGLVAAETSKTPEIVTEDMQPAPSVGDWFLTFFIAAIPLVGLIIMLVWAFDESNRVRCNWARAQLIWSIIVVVIVVAWLASMLRSFHF
jgi:hypothetical protein